MPAYKKTVAELEIELKEQIQALRDRAAAYDAGKRWEAKYLAGITYVLTHNGGKSRSLLGQLRLRPIFIDSSKPAAIFAGGLHMAYIRLSKESASFQPYLGDAPWPPCETRLGKWWDQTVFVGPNGAKLTRRNIVFTLRSQMGGAHVDPQIDDEAFHYLAVKGAPGMAFADGAFWTSFRSDVPGQPVREGHYATMRQIAWEMDETLKWLGL